MLVWFSDFWFSLSYANTCSSSPILEFSLLHAAGQTFGVHKL